MDPADRANIAEQAEAAVARVLRAEGFFVTNLNGFGHNCSFADLTARRDPHRVLLQVKGTITATGKFSTPPDKARALRAIGIELGCHAVYAFVRFIDNGRGHHRYSDVHLEPARLRWPVPFAPEETTIRFANAGKVAVLGDQAEDVCAGTCRYHVTMDQFTVEASQLHRFLDHPLPMRAGPTERPKFWWPDWTWPL